METNPELLQLHIQVSGKFFRIVGDDDCDGADPATESATGAPAPIAASAKNNG